MDALPASYVDQRCCNLAEQSFHEAGEFDPASRARLHERRLLLEQAWLVMFGFVRHYGLSPFLIRTGESLGARRPRHVSSAEFGVENVAPCRSRNEMLLVQSSMPASWRMSRRVAARRRTRRLRIRAVVQSAPLRQSADGTGR